MASNNATLHVGTPETDVSIDNKEIMVARNDITGDAIQTKNASQSYRDNYDNIFRKDKVTPAVQENTEEIGKCGCGRSPTGKCIGWHGLTEDEFAARLEAYQTGKVDLAGNEVK